jgi:hypothetical protein
MTSPVVKKDVVAFSAMTSRVWLAIAGGGATREAYKDAPLLPISAVLDKFDNSVFDPFGSAN